MSSVSDQTAIREATNAQEEVFEPPSGCLALTSMFLAGALCAATKLPPELEQQVSRLLSDIKAEPTTAENIVSRSRVLWDWANYLLARGRLCAEDVARIRRAGAGSSTGY